MQATTTCVACVLEKCDEISSMISSVAASGALNAADTPHPAPMAA